MAHDESMPSIPEGETKSTLANNALKACKRCLQFADDVLTWNNPFASSIYLMAANGAFWFFVLNYDEVTHMIALLTVALLIFITDAIGRAAAWFYADTHIEDNAVHTTEACGAVGYLNWVNFLLKPLFLIAFIFRWLFALFMERTGEYLIATSCVCCCLLLAFDYRTRALYLAYSTAMFLLALPALKDRKAFETVKETIVRFVHRLCTSVSHNCKKLYCTIISSIHRFCTYLYCKICDFFFSIYCIVHAVYDTIVRSVLAIGNGIVSFYRFIVNSCLAAVRAVRNTVSNCYYGTITLICRMIAAVKTFIRDSYLGTVRLIKGTILATRNFFVGTFYAIVDGIRYFVLTVRNAVVNGYLGICRCVKRIVVTIRDFMINTYWTIVNGISRFFMLLNSSFWSCLNRLKNGLIGMYRTFVNSVRRLILAVRNSVVNFSIGTKQSVYNGLYTVKTKLIDIYNRTLAGLRAAWDSFKNYCYDSLHRLKAACLKGIADLKTAILALCNRIKQKCVRLLKDLRDAVSAYLHYQKERLKAYIRHTFIYPILKYFDAQLNRLKAYLNDQWNKFRDYVDEKAVQPALAAFWQAYACVSDVVTKIFQVFWALFYHELFKPAFLRVYEKIPRKAPYLESDSEDELVDYVLPQPDKSAESYLNAPCQQEDSDSELLEFVPPPKMSYLGNLQKNLSEHLLHAASDSEDDEFEQGLVFPGAQDEQSSGDEFLPSDQLDDTGEEKRINHVVKAVANRGGAPVRHRPALPSTWRDNGDTSVKKSAEADVTEQAQPQPQQVWGGMLGSAFSFAWEKTSSAVGSVAASLSQATHANSTNVTESPVDADFEMIDHNEIDR